jgi:hypothetical protein
MVHKEYKYGPDRKKKTAFENKPKARDGECGI